MNIQEQLEPLTCFLPMDALLDKLRFPLKYLPEDIEAIIPSTIIGNDGLVLDRILLLSENCICDVVIPVPLMSASFDYALRKPIRNYRLDISTHEIKEGDVTKASFEIAAVTLLHSFASMFGTKLTYAGHDRDKWLENVMRLFPVSIVLDSLVKE